MAKPTKRFLKINPFFVLIFWNNRTVIFGTRPRAHHTSVVICLNLSTRYKSSLFWHQNNTHPIPFIYISSIPIYTLSIRPPLKSAQHPPRTLSLAVLWWPIPPFAQIIPLTLLHPYNSPSPSHTMAALLFEYRATWLVGGRELYLLPSWFSTPSFHPPLTPPPPSLPPFL